MNAEQLLDIAKKLEDDGEISKAIDAYKQILKQHPDSKEANVARWEVPYLSRKIETVTSSEYGTARLYYRFLFQKKEWVKC